jgi:putative copper resistance protein D
VTRPAARPRPVDRFAPVLWAGLAVAAALVASVLAGTAAGPMLPAALGASATRAGMVVAAVACVGLGLLTILLPVGLPYAREAAQVEARADRAIVAAAGAWLVLTLLGIGFRTADAFGRPLAALRGDDVLRWSTQLAAGRGMILTAGCAAVVLGCAVARVSRPDAVAARIPLVAALLGALTPAVTGHAGSSPDHQLAAITIALHVGAAALWVGGLGAVLALVARRRILLDATLPRFSRLAGVCVVGVALTGLLNAQLRTPSWGALFGTAYGGLVVAKLVALALIAVLGGLARRRLTTGRRPVLRWAGLEVAMMAATLGLAATLAQTA